MPNDKTKISDDPTRAGDPDFGDRVARFSLTVWTYRMGETVSLMVHLGDRLGLYRALADVGPVSAGELAAKTGLDQRMVDEWLLGQAAARLIDRHPDGRFELNPVQAAVLADESDSPACAVGAFNGGIPRDVMDAIEESFRTGRGITYQQQGPAAAAGLGRMTAPSTKANLVNTVIASIDDLDRRLSEGATVIDVGSGAGVALCTIAANYPASYCVGIDPSASARDLARARAAELGLTNVEFRPGSAEQLADVVEDLDTAPTLIMTLDVLHDLPFPDRAAASVNEVLAPDGVWLVKEIRSTGNFDDDLRNPLLPLFYGFSVFSCLQSALSEPAGMGLGTLGLHPERLRSLVADAGFGSVIVHDVNEPANLYYEIRR